MKPTIQKFVLFGATGDLAQRMVWPSLYHLVREKLVPATLGFVGSARHPYSDADFRKYVEGALRTRKWQDKEGKERYTTEIVAERMQMLGSRSGMGDAGARGGDDDKAPVTAGEGKPAKKPAGKFDDMDDDIPF